MTNDFTVLRIEINYLLTMLYQTFGKYYRDTAEESFQNIFNVFFFNEKSENLNNNIKLIENYIDTFNKIDNTSSSIIENNIPAILKMIKILNMEYSTK